MSAPYFIVKRIRPAKRDKYLCRPILDSTRWSWSVHMIRAARFQDWEQAEAYSRGYKDAETMRVGDDPPADINGITL